MNIFARANIRAGDHVAIVGVGFLGMLLVQLAVDAGAKVIACGRRAGALQLARELGAEHTHLLDDHARIIDAVKSLTDERLCNVVIECVGKQSPLDLATELTGVRGRLVIAGYHQDGPRQVNMQLWNWRGLDVINAHERDPRVYLDGIRGAVDAVLTGRLKLDRLITHRLPLEQLGKALDLTRDRPDGFMKALITTSNGAT
jgi:threonine dehydrogenase-like Zn-dependent dehydrogenase